MTNSLRLTPVIATLLLATSPLGAQTRGAQVTLQAGIASAADAYQSNCGHSSLAFGVDVQGKGRVFPQASLERFTGAGGGDVLCIPAPTAGGSTVGGLRLEGATRLGIGFGARSAPRAVQLEGVVSGGLISGRNGFVDRPDDDRRRVRPQVGGQGSLVVARVLLLSAAMHWTRLTLDAVSPTGNAGRLRTEWSPVVTMHIGVRFP
ncbi:MAG: hypothetical protein ACK6DP_17200 [Gemmatimonas sp.]|jgi:hypothetical protein|uniref:hypothetical protein n=1 Tax=Gemmatimonas sp. TaxID=1962908 RepID=UPI00391F58B3|nr:hypothetical protein [Gemmatimonadota bacterium]